MSEPETQRVLVNIRYPDDPALEWVYREDGSVEQLSGPPGVVMEIPKPPADAPPVTVRIEHSPEGEQWTDLWP